MYTCSSRSVTGYWTCTSFSVTLQSEISAGSQGSRSSLHFLNWQLEKLYSTGRDKRHGASEECVGEERKQWWMGEVGRNQGRWKLLGTEKWLTAHYENPRRESNLFSRTSFCIFFFHPQMSTNAKAFSCHLLPVFFSALLWQREREKGIMFFKC